MSKNSASSCGRLQIPCSLKIKTVGATGFDAHISEIGMKRSIKDAELGSSSVCCWEQLKKQRMHV